MNRIAASVARYQAKIEAMGEEEHGIGLNGQPIQSLHEKNKLAFDEFCAYQNARAVAFASGKLTLEEAQYVYSALGGECYQGDWPAGTKLAVKLTLTQLMGELLIPAKVPQMAYRR